MENFELVDLHVRQDNTGVFFQPVSQEGGQGCQYDFVAPENSIRAEDRKVQDILTQILKVNFTPIILHLSPEEIFYPESVDEV